ncbi:TetR/AcrR family transcriptional regulator [Corynebacterium mendelii]|uniref:TetR/AcrR family transcriptional regulator n=1 Tax=Corynebacterium mendelii TaxID=2765362 RepID=A0A939DYW7_9CORY|nr:TetR/AcrR family transcriptional regulator [Corynebacterium mendelii]MBN9643391.1 TetR/AcrR family transcriptional regulator [Corynebacterium mendelii]
MRRDAKKRRLKIIDAATELFREHSHTVPLETVAARAGVGIATLYRNFPDRTSLLHACGSAVLARAIDLQDDVLAHFDDDPRSQWHRYVTALVDMGLGAMVSTFAPEDMDRLPADVAALRTRAAELGNEILSRAHAAGLVAEPITHQRFLAGLVTVTRPPVVGIRKLEPDTLPWLVGIYVAGLAHGGTPQIPTGGTAG